MTSMPVGVREITTVVALFATVAVAGCAKGHGRESPAPAQRHAVRGFKMGHGPITAEELRAVGDRDAYSAIELLRPQFLRYRGEADLRGRAPVRPEVFVDGVFYGPISSLAGIPVGELSEIRLLTVGDAALKYGQGHTAGVIDITSKH